MGKKTWAYFIFLSFISQISNAADGVTASGIPGAVTYPVGAGTNGAGSKPKTSIAVPTPDTLPPPDLGPNGGGTSPTSIPRTPVNPKEALGQCRKKSGGGETTVDFGCIIDRRYKHSVVRVLAKDLSGNILAKAMGVAIGRNAQYIAAPLSIVLGNTQQWADRIEVTHFAGNKYDANVALIDEEKNLVILSPEAAPAPIVFVAETDERPQLDVYTISFRIGRAHV